jgi:hypothetical protein
LIDGYIIAHLGGLPYHDPYSVVDKYISTDFGGGMNVDICNKLIDRHNKPRQPFKPFLVEGVGYSVVDQCDNSGVGKEQFNPVSKCRVTIFDRFKVV